jgi:hypothetical protein
LGLSSAGEKKRVDADDGLPDTSVGVIPILILMRSDREGGELRLDRLDFSGPLAHGGRVADVGAGDGGGLVPGDFAMELVEQLLVDAAMGGTERGGFGGGRVYSWGISQADWTAGVLDPAITHNSKT